MSIRQVADKTNQKVAVLIAVMNAKFKKGKNKRRGTW